MISQTAVADDRGRASACAKAADACDRFEKERALLAAVARYSLRHGRSRAGRGQPKWGTLFDVDNTLATALIDRLMHHGEALVIKGDSYRMSQALVLAAGGFTTSFVRAPGPSWRDSRPSQTHPSAVVPSRSRPALQRRTIPQQLRAIRVKPLLLAYRNSAP